MKRMLIILIFIIVTTGAFAQTIELQPNSVPVNPYLAGQGGSFTANSHGYNSLFKNPAGFAMDDGDFTLFSTNVWAFIDQSLIDFAMNPTAVEQNLTTQLAAVDEAEVTEWVDGKTEDELVGYLEDAGFLEAAGIDLAQLENDPQAYIDQKLQELESNPEAILEDEQLAAATINLANTVVEEITGEELFPSGNMRVGGNFGLLGIVGKGFGIGVNLNADVNLAGQTIIDADGYAALTATGTFGYALEVLPDFLTVGAALRPMYRVYVPVSGQEAMSLVAGADNIMTTMNAYSAYAGWGIGIDAGAIMELGNLKIGLTLSDILDTRLNYNRLTVGDISAGLETGTFPEGQPVEDVKYVIPMDVSAGVGYLFDFGGLGSLDVHGEISNAVRATRAFIGGEDFDYLSLVHAGANWNLFDFLGVMAGYNEGYLSAGVSLDLFFVEIAAAGFMQANTANVGYSDFGASIEAAIRF